MMESDSVPDLENQEVEQHLDVTDAELELFRILEGLQEKWTPHPMQIEIGHALFYEHAKNIFIVAGRNFGKTEIASYCCWRYAMQNPGSQNYIFEPFQKQAREILWASNRIQTFGPKDWIESTNNTEMRITFKNGSFIKLEGSDNVAAIAGIKPKGLIVYDEFKDHRLAAVQNFEPNRAAFDVPALFIGTPPIIHNHFVDYAEMAKVSPHWKFFHAPTSSNPHIKKEWLARMKEQMESMGELEEYLRSYEALFIRGGKATIFPWIMTAKFPDFEEIRPIDLNRWLIVVAFDPGSSSTFAATFILHNPYSKQSIIFDEIYEQEMSKMTTSQIWKATQEKLKPWKDLVKSINYVYDEAALWFANELMEHHPDAWLEPSNKSEFGVDGYITMVRTVMRKGFLTITKNCVKTIWEFENYIKDDKGKIPKVNDHLINANQYGLGSLGYDWKEDSYPKETHKVLPRYVSLETDLQMGNSYAEI